MASMEHPAAITPLQVTSLDDRALVQVAGADWRSFLQGLITQDVEGLAAGEMRYAALLTPQGRVLYDLFVTADQDGAGALLDVAAATRDALIGRLRIYRLRAKVEIEPAAGVVSALYGGGPGSSGWSVDPRLAALGWRGLDLEPPSGAVAAGAAAYDGHRLGLGVADMARDGLADSAYALEANLDLLNGVDFRKGCFVGQETTSRMKRRSAARSRIAPLRFEGTAPLPGAEVMAGALRAGEVRSGADGVALALMRLDRAVGADLTVQGRAVRLNVPAWLQPAVDAALVVDAT